MGRTLEGGPYDEGEKAEETRPPSSLNNIVGDVEISEEEERERRQARLARPQALDKISEADAELGPSMIRFMKDKDEIRKEIKRLRVEPGTRYASMSGSAYVSPITCKQYPRNTLARRMPWPNGSGIWTDRGSSFAKSTALPFVGWIAGWSSSGCPGYYVPPRTPVIPTPAAASL